MKFSPEQALAVLRAAEGPLTSREVLTRLRESVGLTPYGGTPYRDVRCALDKLAAQDEAVSARWEGWEVFTGDCEPRNRYAPLVNPAGQRDVTWMTPELGEKWLTELTEARARITEVKRWGDEVGRVLGATVEIHRNLDSGEIEFTLRAKGGLAELERLAALVVRREEKERS